MVTAITIYDDFRKFFEAHPLGVYPYADPPLPRSKGPAMEHSVICYGYDNDKGFWRCLNSWSTTFADKGKFRASPVLSNTCATCTYVRVQPACVHNVHGPLLSFSLSL